MTSLVFVGYALHNLQSRQGQHQKLSCPCVRDSYLPVSGVRTCASLDSARDPVLTGRSNVRHIKGILPVVYKQRVMDISTKTASEIMFATGNANKLREVRPAALTALTPLLPWPCLSGHAAVQAAGGRDLMKTALRCRWWQSWRPGARCPSQ